MSLRIPVLAAAVLCMAQAPAPPVPPVPPSQQQQPPAVQALQEEVIKLTGETIDLRAAVIASQRQAAELAAQVKALTAKQEPEKKPEAPK